MLKREKTRYYNTKNLTIISLLTALIVAIKYAFGFIPGVEFVTLFFAIYAVFLPILMSGTIAISFAIISTIIYGGGTWVVMYFFIWPIEVILGWLFRNALKKNNFVFSAWVAFWGFSILLWFFLHDVIVFDKAYAISQLSSGVVTNLIESASNFVIGLIAFYPLKNLFEKRLILNANYFW